uniref:Uncharacterized protein n=1 Tax=Meloidogyne enterolobii TaxID=390850 RepID=A0A6V7X3B0_MELEN|nr:unnamed protein product [Meloidogyne enterolobii]
MDNIISGICVGYADIRQNFFPFQRRRRKFWEIWKILKPKIFHFAPQIGA